MTEQSKIPVPDADEAQRDTLIERAAERYDFSRLAAPPIPGAAEARALRREQPSVPAQAAAPSPVRPADVPSAAAAPAGESSPAPALPQARPVFSGERHSIDRERLRDNGLIVPFVRKGAKRDRSIL